ncbi:MAG: subclass B3 metallo-beta-lactamase [Bacteroidetes bacterium]|nr:subclass B3 metallo-beta-lactamase [Bacteroidota bacterium]
MNKCSGKYRFLVFFFLILVFNSNAQEVNEPRGNAEWIKPYEPFRIAGNLYYVGTYDLACYLIVTDEGNILINTGLASSASQIKNNVEKLGFKFSAIRILLTTQAHYDHLGAMAAIKKQTGAKFLVDAADADVVVTGGKSDYEMGKYGMTFQPVQADGFLNDGDSISFGGTTLKLLHHPGHTKGSCSYLFIVKDDQRSYKILIANLPTIIVNRRFEDIHDYPNIANDYAYTLHAMKNIHFDLWFASHASQFHLHEKHQPGDAYNPMVFADQKGYDEALAELQKRYDEKIQEDKKLK